LGGFLLATYGHRGLVVLGTGLTVKAAQELAVVGLAYLGLGFLLWVLVLLLALVMR
jgi:hypothetical protein